MYISSVKVKNFRTLQKEGGAFHIEIDPNFQIIAGANNSGKSNFLRALNLFFNGSIEDDKVYEKERDISFHKGNQGTGSHVDVEIEVDLFLNKEEIQKINHLEDYIVNNNIIRTKCIFKDNENKRYFANKDGKFPNRKNLEKNLITKGPLAVFFKRIKFIYIPTHTDLNQKINELVAEEILPSMVDGWGNKGLAKNIKDLKTDINSLDIRIKEILQKKNVLISEKFRETIALFPEIQAGVPINQFMLEVALKDDDLNAILAKRIDLLIKDSSHNTIDSKGSGIQKIALITLLEYFSQNIEDMARYTNPFLIWGIDEPESFMQPKLQKKLREKLEKVSLTHQIIISTHSPQLINILNPANVKLFVLATEPIQVTRKGSKMFFKKETRFLGFKDNNFIEKLKEHLGVEINDGWVLQKRNILFEGMDDIIYFNTTFKSIMGYSLTASNISCNSSENMPNFTELIYQKISDKKLKKNSLLCLVDNDDAGRKSFNQIKSKSFVKSIKTFSLYLSAVDNQNDNYPSMIEDCVIPEIFFEAVISFLKRKNAKSKLNKFDFNNFFIERQKMKRIPMPEFLNMYFDSIIKHTKNFTFTSLDVKYGLSLEYESILTEKTFKITDVKNKYPQLVKFLEKFI